MEEGKFDLKIEKQYSDRTFTTLLIEGFSPEEMNEILHPKEHKSTDDALCDLLEKHGYGDTANCWHNGYGIYGIRHFGGHLMVEIGNSCD
jgi:hypothetical protein